jgi:DNA-binding winged helix-turn-helix (wHTH) protein
VRAVRGDDARTPRGVETVQARGYRFIGAVRPAAMMISAGLADPRMKIEIKVTALRQLA